MQEFQNKLKEILQECPRLVLGRRFKINSLNLFWGFIPRSLLRQIQETDFSPSDTPSACGGVIHSR
jgi:hypothetical protein